MRRTFLAGLAFCASLALAACQNEQQAAPPPSEMEVSVVTVSPEAVVITDELPGRVVAYRIAQIRPQVGGLIERRLFDQGGEVSAGDPLFQIDAAPFRAEAKIAAAALKRARTTLAQAEKQVRRLEPLVKAAAVSRQSHDDAVATRDQAAADVEQNQAVLERRELDLDFATVRSPLTGRIDQAMVTEGALVVASDPTPLATVRQIDRVYIDLRQPASRLSVLRALAERGETDQGAPVEILSSDGESHPVLGKLLFSGISVDPGTGDVIARVEVENPHRTLLPGMFVRARLPRERKPDALLVPLQAVQHDGDGTLVNTVDSDGNVQQKVITTGAEIDGRVVIEQGLHPGDRVIVEGQDRLTPGVVVKPMPWHLPRDDTPQS
ncbi:MAG: efflux RND transporter periplasmic adaptor subunit [Rhodospirillum sp.]|nr:efflux RND transporter periplasmic adaptor subunit [Rhodospirillum sp.]MCF8491447.1 efflux RND transporter periplasmic adaptor subunit [Rhodospirillum sp.]MCF8503079.1 efflux RND transporter periplasmic adaptor subunit [Rhodospirillum sp.]